MNCDVPAFQDNTDHTRIFAKVTLSYGKGPRSEPLDLLLFDSQCWECTSEGDCTARTKDRGGSQCFFAAGTSSIQDFRIGRTISTRVSPGELKLLKQILPVSSQLWLSGLQEIFFPFFQLSICNCLSSSSFLFPDDVRTCTLPKDSGGCDNKIFRYYYNAIEVITARAHHTSNKYMHYSFSLKTESGFISECLLFSAPLQIVRLRRLQR